MNYISTRGKTAPMQFSDVLLMGLTPDGGLMLPEEYPQIDEATLTQWRTLSYTLSLLLKSCNYCHRYPKRRFKNTD